ncbi:hypothetical protein FAP39_08670 [Shimia litoralis]|uniref:Phage gp6-like head-tail connector protein n=1 Tax=Shimia litoralis TaxID=420403 RepID=A0A4U7N518_9RHOB|nr:head-tail connector protein [Shimia litoralis]TKZ20880.1 hypothetical protein FAP39_08670 [Shimia litoralis]
MMLVEETSVPSEALPVAEFKAHLRLGSGFSDDTLQDGVLESFLRAAMAAIEARTGKVLITRTFYWSLMMWRTPQGQSLPIGPVVEIQSVTLADRLGEEVVVAPSAYRLIPDQQRPQLRPVAGDLPRIPKHGQVGIRMVCGFGANWSDIPADLQQAVLLLGAHYYEYRDETALSGGCMPFGVTSLIERYRPVRMGVSS